MDTLVLLLAKTLLCVVFCVICVFCVCFGGCVLCVFVLFCVSVASGRSGSGRIGYGRAGIRCHGHALWEWLEPLLQHSDSDESCPAKTCRSVRRPGQAHTDGSAGLLPCQPGRHMYGAAAELQLCPSRHAGLEPALREVRFMQPMTFWTNRPELRLLVWDAA